MHKIKPILKRSLAFVLAFVLFFNVFLSSPRKTQAMSIALPLVTQQTYLYALFSICASVVGFELYDIASEVRENRMYDSINEFLANHEGDISNEIDVHDDGTVTYSPSLYREMMAYANQETKKGSYIELVDSDYSSLIPASAFTSMDSNSLATLNSYGNTYIVRIDTSAGALNPYVVYDVPSTCYRVYAMDGTLYLDDFTDAHLTINKSLAYYDSTSKYWSASSRKATLSVGNFDDSACCYTYGNYAYYLHGIASSLSDAMSNDSFIVDSYSDDGVKCTNGVTLSYVDTSYTIDMPSDDDIDAKGGITILDPTAPGLDIGNDKTSGDTIDKVLQLPVSIPDTKAVPVATKKQLPTPGGNSPIDLSGIISIISAILGILSDWEANALISKIATRLNKILKVLNKIYDLLVAFKDMVHSGLISLGTRIVEAIPELEPITTLLSNILDAINGISAQGVIDAIYDISSIIPSILGILSDWQQNKHLSTIATYTKKIFELLDDTLSPILTAISSISCDDCVNAILSLGDRVIDAIPSFTPICNRLDSLLSGIPILSTISSTIDNVLDSINDFSISFDTNNLNLKPFFVDLFDDLIFKIDDLIVKVKDISINFTFNIESRFKDWFTPTIDLHSRLEEVFAPVVLLFGGSYAFSKLCMDNIKGIIGPHDVPPTFSIYPKHSGVSWAQGLDSEVVVIDFSFMERSIFGWDISIHAFLISLQKFLILFFFARRLVHDIPSWVSGAFDAYSSSIGSSGTVGTIRGNH